MPADNADRGAAARRLVRGCDHAALATSLDGHPYVSLVAVACDSDATPLLLLSDLAQHSRNLAADPRVSLLFVDTAGRADPLAGARLSLVGRAERCEAPAAGARFAARHPASRDYAGFADFHLYRVVPERGHLVAGFGRIAWVAGEDLRFRGETAPLAAAESEIVAHMNSEHADGGRALCRAAAAAARQGLADDRDRSGRAGSAPQGGGRRGDGAARFRRAGTDPGGGAADPCRPRGAGAAGGGIAPLAPAPAAIAGFAAIALLAAGNTHGLSWHQS